MAFVCELVILLATSNLLSWGLYDIFVIGIGIANDLLLHTQVVL